MIGESLSVDALMFAQNDVGLSSLGGWYPHYLLKKKRLYMTATLWVGGNVPNDVHFRNGLTFDFTIPSPRSAVEYSVTGNYRWRIAASDTHSQFFILFENAYQNLLNILRGFDGVTILRPSANLNSWPEYLGPWGGGLSLPVLAPSGEAVNGAEPIAELDNRPSTWGKWSIGGKIVEAGRLYYGQTDITDSAQFAKLKLYTTNAGTVTPNIVTEHLFFKGLELSQTGTIAISGRGGYTYNGQLADAKLKYPWLDELLRKADVSSPKDIYFPLQLF